MNILNNKFLIIGILVVGVSFLLLSFLVISKNQSDLESNLNNLVKVNKTIKKIDTVLPDISPGDPIANSEVRKKEILVVKKKLPYSDPQNRFKIDFSEKTQDVLAAVEGSSIEIYRENKSLAEQILSQFSSNACNLVVFWGPPTSLRSNLTKSDINTSGCPIVFN